MNELHSIALRTAREMGDLDRVILGTDAPAGSGVQPLGIVRMISMFSSLGDLPAEQAFCIATGNTATMRKLDCGIIEPGRAADFVLMDKAQHSSGKDFLDSIRLGDLPGIGMVVIDGVVRCQTKPQHAACREEYRRLSGRRPPWRQAVTERPVPDVSAIRPRPSLHVFADRRHAAAGGRNR